MQFLRLIRFPNLVIVALTQYLIYYRVLLPYFELVETPATLQPFFLFLLVFTTVLIAAGGYIINDIVDHEMDVINKPDKVFIGKTISKLVAWRCYIAIGGLGLAISSYLAWQTNNFRLLFIYPLAVASLHLYSVHFKKQVLIGNIIVALFCAFVPGILLLAEYPNMQVFEQSTIPAFQKMWTLMGGYLLFAFYTTLLREVIKDIEDIEGDQQANCRTLPIVFGISNAKRWAMLMCLIICICLGTHSYFSYFNGIDFRDIYVLLLLIAPTILIFAKLFTANTKKQFSQLSRWTKGLMLFGLVYLLIA